MSHDYALWKEKESAKLTKGLAYLLVANNIVCDQLNLIDSDKVYEKLKEEFPDCLDFEDEYHVELYIGQQGIVLATYSDTPREFVEFFIRFAQEEKMILFDPQLHKVTKQDEQECQRYKKLLESDDQNLEWKRKLPVILKKAEENDPLAMFTLGNCYFFGDGVPKDFQKAFQYYEKAANAGHSEAIFNLASCYLEGEGVAKNVNKAVYYYEQALKEDKYYAPYTLGEIFSNEKHGIADKSKAIHYFKIAAENGNYNAKQFLRKLSENPVQNFLSRFKSPNK